jgi:hypothetical protein
MECYFDFPADALGQVMNMPAMLLSIIITSNNRYTKCDKL